MPKHRAEWTELVEGTAKKKPLKFVNEAVGKYDSKKEYKRAQELKFLEHVGQIKYLEEQPIYELVPKQKGERSVKYVGDFRYVEDGKIVVEDVKSAATKTPLYVVKRKLMLWIHGIRIKEV